MAISIYNIKKWFLMVTGKSTLHVNQNMGKCFVPGKLEGYFNNMTEKVTLAPDLLDSDELPRLTIENGEQVFFPVAIFQYGLGAYDLFLQTNEYQYLKKFEQCVKWAIEHQEPNGAWNNFFYIFPKHPYGAMCQGEGVSLLIRAYQRTNDEKILIATKKALEYMLLSVSDGGTTHYEEDGPVFKEYTHRATVLNGWIFAMFGLYDMMVMFPQESRYTELWNLSLHKLQVALPEFDNGYWSMYDTENKICSPFYHNLQIAQMEALYKVTGNSIFFEYFERWSAYRNKFWNSKRAFIQKAIQKIKE